MSAIVATTMTTQQMFADLSGMRCVLYLFIYVTYNIGLDTLMPGSGLSVDL
ncbi:MAG: hypothetical protein Q4D27_05780 [Coriobacteriia bacterium]|nr:hypothetical protein [Coriobacteriia bacterium]